VSSPYCLGNRGLADIPRALNPPALSTICSMQPKAEPACSSLSHRDLPSVGTQDTDSTHVPETENNGVQIQVICLWVMVEV
jgi:hypothetical protein